MEEAAAEEPDPHEVLGLSPKALPRTVAARRDRLVARHAGDPVELARVRRAAASILNGEDVAVWHKGTPPSLLAVPDRTADDEPVPEPREAQVVRRIRELDRPLVQTRMARASADRWIGLEYLSLKGVIARSNLKAEEWCAQKLNISYRRIKRCVRLAGRWPDFLADNWWYTRVGRKLGWPIGSETGASYAFEVMDIRRRHENGEKPGDRDAALAAKREAAAAEKAAERMRARAEGAAADRRRDGGDGAEEAEAERLLAEEARAAAERRAVDADQRFRWAEAGARRWKARAERLEALLREMGVEPPAAEGEDAPLNFSVMKS